MYAHAQAPARIGIAGGGTDLPAWTKEEPGLCLGLAIKVRVHVVIISRSDRRVVAVYRGRDDALATTEIANGLIRESALSHGFQDSFEVHTLSEMTSKGSGLGVSSAIAVALSAAFSKLKDLRNGITRTETAGYAAKSAYAAKIAESAWHVEIDRLERPIGRQDHVAAAFGGLRLYRFEGKKAEVERTFLPEEAAWAARHLAVIELPERGLDARRILEGATRRDHLRLAYEAVPVAISAIEDRRVDGLGEALKMGQASKTSIPGAVPRWLVDILNRAELCEGVRGCKVAGAGGGGHLIAAIESDQAIEVLREQTQLPVFRFEQDDLGVIADGYL